jgi:hypothetical protein
MTSHNLRCRTNETLLFQSTMRVALSILRRPSEDNCERLILRSDALGLRSRKNSYIFGGRLRVKMLPGVQLGHYV